MFVKKNQYLMFLTSLFIFFLLYEVANCYEIKPYIGFDNQINYLKFKKGYGDNIFKKSHPQTNLYAGLKFNNSFAIEGGCISKIHKNNTSTLNENDIYFGKSIPASLSPATFLSYLRIKEFHVSLIKIYSIEEFNDFNILNGIGISILDTTARIEGILLGNIPNRGTARSFNRKKVILRFMVASEYKLKNNLGLRASVCFLKTSRMAISAHAINGSRFNPIIKPKDSFIYSMGIFYEF